MVEPADHVEQGGLAGPVRADDGQDLTSPDVEADPAPGDEDRYGVLGADLFRLFDTVIIDFGSMRLEAYDED